VRFAGISNLYGVNAADIFKARILVVGLGGVGSWVAESLARSGIGNLDLLDLDDICMSNVNRQIHALDDNIGLSKSKVMQQRIKQINPDCRINAYEDFLTQDNLCDYVTKDLNMVIDCIDSVRVKAALISFCKRRKIKIITTGASGGKTNASCIQILDLSKTYNDPLAAKVRSTLRHDYGFSRNPKRSFSVPCVFSNEQMRYNTDCGDISFAKVNAGTNISCANGLGSSCMVTATFGLMAASLAVNKLVMIRQNMPIKG